MEGFRSDHPEIAGMWEKRDTDGLIEVLFHEDVVLRVEAEKVLAAHWRGGRLRPRQGAFAGKHDDTEWTFQPFAVMLKTMRKCHCSSAARGEQGAAIPDRTSEKEGGN